MCLAMVLEAGCVLGSFECASGGNWCCGGRYRSTVVMDENEGRENVKRIEIYGFMVDNTKPKLL